MLLLALLLSTNSAVAPTRDSHYVVPYEELSKSVKKQIDCLAINIYREAAGESLDGWFAVAAVTMNRALSGKFPSSLCGVVYQKTGSTYQFSWVGMTNRLNKINTTVYNQIQDIATLVYLNYDSSMDNTKGATFYHADYVRPNWSRLEKTTKIGRHIFYRD